MSTEILVLGYSIAKTTLYIFAGLLGGFFPFFYDLINRQKMPTQQKIELNIEFFITKALITPLLALIVTIFAVAFNSITNWSAAMYLGASLPILVEKVIGTSKSTVASLASEQ